MVKTREQVKPNNAPIYAAALYKGMAEIFVKHGYALAVHGSLARDIDLIGIPWDENVSEPEEVIRDILATYAVSLAENMPEKKRYGRVAYTLYIGFGECYMDLSFMPIRQ